MDEWNQWKGKKVFLKLKRGREYSGTVKDIRANGQIIFMSLLDRYGKTVAFAVSEIKIIQEEEDEGKLA